ncbi:MAG: GNAT family N-acetyltransferase [Chloroflexi bacterium]|nr:GNAT family N-acetyltransferase [Chloroflexota bacterium]
MIEGRLVTLRPREMSDLVDMHRWINDDRVTRFIANRYPWSMAAEEAFLKRQVGAPGAYGDVRLSIDTKEGRHIGNIGLRCVVEDRSGTLGMMIGEPDCWSRGYGRDALQALLKFAFGEMNLTRIDLEVLDFNERAQACYRSCGFVVEGRRRQAVYRRGAWHDLIVMGLLQREWAGQKAT